MGIYIFLLIGVVLVGVPLCSNKAGRSGRMIYCIAAAVVFIAISALRFMVGYDYSMYGATYFNMRYMYAEDLMFDRMEKGFLMPLYALNLGYEDYTVVFIYTSIIIYAALFYLIYKNSSCPWISTAAYLCFGLYFNSLCFLRQVMAAMLVAYAMKFFDRKMPIRFFVLVISASVFHWSALLMLLLYFLLKIKPGYIYLGVITAGTVIFCMISRKLMYWAIDHFYMYRGYDPETSIEAMAGLSPKFTIMFGILFIIAFVFRKRLIDKNKANAVYLNCLMYTTVFEAIGLRHAVLSRFAILVYITPIIYMVPDLVKVISEFVSEKFEAYGKKRIQVFNACSMGVLSLFFVGSYVMLMLGNYNGVVPYVSQINRPYDIFIEQVITEEDNEEEWIEEDEEWLEEQLRLEDDGGEYPENGGEDLGSEPAADSEYVETEAPEETEETEPFDEEQFEQDLLNQLQGLS